MKLEIKTSIEIDAKPQVIWKILTDQQNYPQWNPFVTSMKGELKQGNRISVELPGMKIKPVVVTFVENQELSWLGTLGPKGIFDGRHSFRIVEGKEGKTIFIHSEQFNGILVPLFKKKLLSGIKSGFEHMNHCLKKEAEQAIARDPHFEK